MVTVHSRQRACGGMEGVMSVVHMRIMMVKVAVMMVAMEMVVVATMVIGCTTLDAGLVITEGEGHGAGSSEYLFPPVLLSL